MPRWEDVNNLQSWQFCVFSCSHLSVSLWWLRCRELLMQGVPQVMWKPQTPTWWRTCQSTCLPSMCFRVPPPPPREDAGWQQNENEFHFWCRTAPGSFYRGFIESLMYFIRTLSATDAHNTTANIHRHEGFNVIRIHAVVFRNTSPKAFCSSYLPGY